VVAAVVLVVRSSTGAVVKPLSPHRATTAAVRRLPPYWIVRPGDTLTQIADRTGLTLSELEAFNPSADPGALVPGQRLNLWRHPPAPPPKPPPLRVWKVRPGDSLGLIAAKTGIGLGTLEQLNPGLASRTLQPGDRVRLR
jgi:LysM repeat protein